MPNFNNLDFENAMFHQGIALVPDGDNKLNVFSEKTFRKLQKKQQKQEKPLGFSQYLKGANNG